MLIFWFQIFNGWSGEVAVEDLYLLLYNLVFTSVPPVITAIVDQNLPPDLLLSTPALYANSQQDKVGLDLVSTLDCCTGANDLHISYLVLDCLVARFWNE